MTTNVTIDLTDDERRMLAASLGKSGLATRDDVRRIAKQAISRKLDSPVPSAAVLAAPDPVYCTQTAVHVAEMLLRDLAKLQRASGIPGDVLSAIQTAVHSSLPNFIKAVKR